MATPIPGPGLNPPPVPRLTSRGFTDPVWSKWLDQLRNRVVATVTAVTFSGVDISGVTTQTPSGQISVMLSLSSTGVTAGTYGDSSHVGQFTVDVKGRITAAQNVAIVVSPVAPVGTTAARPVGVSDGFMYLDTTIQQPIWRLAAAGGSGWINAAGVPV